MREIWVVVLLVLPSPPRYTAELLACAAFSERTRSEIRVVSSGVPREESLGRDGVVLLRVLGEEPRLSFEAWYDSLVVWRAMPEGRVEPDTDGLIGGRWRGRLDGLGAAALDQRPFMPPEVLQASDLSDLFADFLPPLAPGPLEVGARWRDTAGLEIERLPDSTSGPARVARYHWRAVTVGAPAGADSGIRVDERVVDDGVVAWTDLEGPVHWARAIEIESSIARGGGVRTPLRTRVMQRITVSRLGRHAACG
jgi:hypothetical protein